MSDTYEKFVRGGWLVLIVLAGAAIVGALRLELDIHRNLEASHAALKHSNDVEDQAIATQKALVVDVDAIKTAAVGAVGNLNGAVAQLNSATVKQIDTLSKTQREVAKSAADLHDLIGHTDLSLNGDDLRPGLLRKAAVSLDQFNALEAGLAQPVADVGAATAKLPAILTDAQTITHNSADTSAHLDTIAANGDLTSHDIQQWVHRETTPVRGTWNVIKGFLMEFAGPAAQVATAAK